MPVADDSFAGSVVTVGNVLHMDQYPVGGWP